MTLHSDGHKRHKSWEEKRSNSHYTENVKTIHLNKWIYYIQLYVYAHTHTHTPTYTELDILLEQIYIIKFIQVGVKRNITPRPYPLKN